jgi:hypothetical protein
MGFIFIDSFTPGIPDALLFFGKCSIEFFKYFITFSLHFNMLILAKTNEKFYPTQQPDCVLFAGEQFFKKGAMQKF